MTTTVGSGLGSSLGQAVETTYGAFVTPTKWVEYGSHTILWKPNRPVGMGLANGLGVQRRSQRQQTTSTVTGDIVTQAFYKGLGQYFGSLFGSLGTAPVQQGGTTAYLQTHAFTTNNYGQSLSLQAGMPQLGGTIVVRNWSGCKVTKGVFDCKQDDIMKMTFTVDGRAEDTAAGRSDSAGTTNTSPTVTDVSITAHDLGAPVTGTGIPSTSYVGLPLIPGVSFTLSSSATSQVNAAATATGSPTITVGTAYGSPSYTTANPVFSFRDANFQIGAFGSEVTVEGIRSVTLTVDRPTKVDNFYQDGSGLKQQQVTNGFTKITMEIESDYISDAAFVGQFVSDTSQSVIWDFLSSSSTAAGTAHQFELKFAIPNIQWDNGPPTVSGPDIVQPKLTLVGLYDDSHTPMTITYMSTDTTL